MGLTGALAPLGLGGVIGTVETTIDGLPVVGGPVGGLVHTVDGAVGIGSLLNPVHRAKRQDLSGLLVRCFDTSPRLANTNVLSTARAVFPSVDFRLGP